MSKQRDSQRARVYDFEREWVHPLFDRMVKMTLDECHVLIQWALAHAGLDPEEHMPHLDDGRGHRHARGSRYEITLPKWSRFTSLVLHETAHVIVDLYDGHLAWHGPEFCRMYFHLVAKTGKIAETDLVTFARESGLKVASATFLSRIKAQHAA